MLVRPYTSPQWLQFWPAFLRGAPIGSRYHPPLQTLICPGPKLEKYKIIFKISDRHFQLHVRHVRISLLLPLLNGPAKVAEQALHGQQVGNPIAHHIVHQCREQGQQTNVFGELGAKNN